MGPFVLEEGWCIAILRVSGKRRVGEVTTPAEAWPVVQLQPEMLGGKPT
jgi:hypothetical protein